MILDVRPRLHHPALRHHPDEFTEHRSPAATPDWWEGRARHDLPTVRVNELRLALGASPLRERAAGSEAPATTARARDRGRRRSPRYSLLRGCPGRPGARRRRPGTAPRW